jgi:hypothetical protein
LGNTSLADQFPSLYTIVNTENVRVADERWEAWLDLVSRVMHVQLSDEPDKFIWNLTVSRNFLVKSLYADFMNGHTVFLKKYIWKLKVPLKIRIFM